MKSSWRWFGEGDPISLEMVKATGVEDVVHALNVPSGEEWTIKDLLDRKTEIEKYGMKWTVVESLPWTADMLLGKEKRDLHIENYLKSLNNLKKVFQNEVPVILYNLMLWADWYRSSFGRVLPEGNLAGEFIVKDMEEAMNPKNIVATIEGMAKMRGWNSIYAVDESIQLLKESQNITENQLWTNIRYCLDAIIPHANKLGIKLAIHPDDPPQSIFGIPRVMHNEEHFLKLFKEYPQESNGMCLCVGSLSANKNVDIFNFIPKVKDRIHNAHWRVVQRLDEQGSFYEAQHHLGSVSLAKAVKLFLDLGINCNYRCDHAEWIWKHLETKVTLGYSGIGRIAGTRYLLGVIDGIKTL